MKEIDKKIFDSIKNTAILIDENLKLLCNKGIYFAPEIYLTFCIGQKIMENREDIFGTNNKEWLREKDLGNGGPSDIVFSSEDGKPFIVIELKLRDTYQSYEDDIKKLLNLQGNFTKYFCVFLDSFSKSNDERLTNLENNYKEKLIKVGHFSFKTWNNWYQNQVYCNLNLYRVESKDN